MTTACYRIWFLALAGQILVGCLAAAEGSPADDAAPWPPQIHPWGDFQPGAWKVVQLTTENYNDQGALVSANLCDSKTVLAKRDNDSLTLEVRVVTEASGQRLKGPLYTIVQGYHGESPVPTLRVKEPVPEVLEIENRKISCFARQVESAGPNGKTVATLHYSPNTTPSLLKRHSVTTDLQGHPLRETTTTVETLEMPFKFQGTLLSTTHLKTVEKTHQGTTVTLAVFCPKIPGGIVSHSSKELDAGGRLIRRSTLELLDYGAEPEPKRPKYYNRRRSRRYRTE
ncbi:MAG: hypothetical protein JXB10_13810 [Pirellulales bacterium]|nr:hypothetical protein [Pirellulales bacterium]